MVCVLVTQLCPILCNPMDYNSQGSSVHGILQARILQWADISFSGIAEGGEAKITLGGACVSSTAWPRAHRQLGKDRVGVRKIPASDLKGA